MSPRDYIDLLMKQNGQVLKTDVAWISDTFDISLRDVLDLIIEADAYFNNTGAV